MARSEFRFAHRLRVRWAEVDRQDIVFNGHYLTYCDVGITEYWRAIGLPYPTGTEGTGADLYTVKTTIDYRGPARYDDLLDVCVRAARIGRSSMRFLVEIHRVAPAPEALLIDAEVIYVTANPATRVSVPVPEALRAAIARFEGWPPGGSGDPAWSQLR